MTEPPDNPPDEPQNDSVLDVTCPECGAKWELSAQEAGQPEFVCNQCKTTIPLTDAGEKQLCLSCTARNEPEAHFCAECGAPLTSYASTAPFERIFAEGSVYRKATDSPQSFIVVFGVWLICLPLAVGGLILLFSPVGGLFLSLISVLLICFSVTFIWKSTRNYLTGKRNPSNNEEEAQPGENK